MAKILINQNDGNRYPDVRDIRGTSKIETTDAINDALTITGLCGIFTETGIPETVLVSSTLAMDDDSTLEIGPGVTLEAATGFSGVLVSATSKSNVKITGDGRIVCTASTAPTFTSCTNVTIDVRIEDDDGEYLPPIVSSSWQRIPSLWRLRLTGTGTCTIDAKDSEGNITLSVESFGAGGATDQIEFPYAGDDAVFVRFTLTGTCRAEIL